MPRLGCLVTGLLEDHGFTPAELFEMDAPEAIIILVAQGLGVTLLPDWGFRPSTGQTIRTLPIRDARYARSTGLIIARQAREGLAMLFATAVADSI